MPFSRLDKRSYLAVELKRAAKEVKRRRRFVRLGVESLEPRMMLDSGLPAAIVVGRTLSASTASAVQNGQFAITYTVYNEQAEPISGVLLSDTLRPGVTFANASPFPDRDGQDLAWSLGTIQGFGRASVTLTVTLTDVAQPIDSGAHTFATLDAALVTDDAPVVVLHQESIDPALLASTPDANTTDPFIQEKAAAFDYAPQRINDFLKTEIGYESYAGSLRGARGTLWNAAGNALDVASLGVALMRASGIPARYASGTLIGGQAQQLIASMFPPNYQSVGLIPSGTDVADPASNQQLISTAQDHYWFQFDPGTGMVDVDPLVSAHQITSATSVFSEVPEQLRAKTEVKLTAEQYLQASAALGGSSGLGETIVLKKTLNDVDLVGRPLTIGHLVTENNIASLIFLSRTTTYSPYLEIGDEAFDSRHDQLIRGTDFQEVFTNFPLGNTLLTGLFLDIELTGPGVAAKSYQRALVDRIGYAVRNGTDSSNVSVDPNGPPVLTENDVWTLNISAALASPRPNAARNQELRNDSNRVADAAASPTHTPDLAATIVGMQTGLTQLLGNEFLSVSDIHTRQIAAAALVAAYYDRPRVLMVSSHADTSDDSPKSTLVSSIDIIRDSLRVEAAPGQNPRTVFAFNLSRGIYENAVERNVIAGLSAMQGVAAPINNTLDVFAATAAQGIGLILISQQNLSALDALNLPAEAKARITNAVDQEDMEVIVPVQSILINGVPTTAWDEINPNTGELIGVTQDGGHEALLEFVDLYLEAEENFELLHPLAGVLGGFFTGSVLSVGFEFAYAASGDRKIAAAELAQNKEDAVEFAEHLEEEIKNRYEAAMALTVLALTGQDPPLSPQFVGLQIGPILPLDHAEGTVAASSTITTGPIHGTVKLPGLAVSGQVSATWDSASINHFFATSLQAASATIVNNSTHASVSGLVKLTARDALPTALAGNAAYQVNGHGSLSFYGAAETNLGASGNWESVDVTVNGSVSLTLNTDQLTVNGQALPAGNYTITAPSALLHGSGASTTPTFSGSASLNLTSGIVNLGSTTDVITLGNAPLDLKTGATLAGYSGTLAIAAESGLDSVTLDGTAADLLRVIANPQSLTADQNLPAVIQVHVETSLAGQYDLSVQAPREWAVSVNDLGEISVRLPAGVQAGIFPIQIVAQSKTRPEFVAQTIVNVTVEATQPAITLAVDPDPIFTVPYQGAVIPTAFRAVIENHGPAADTLGLTFSNISNGFRVRSSHEQVTIPAGKVGVVGVYFEPDGTQPLPVVGTPVSFKVTATSTSHAAITETRTVNFTMPEAHGLTLTVNPIGAGTIPGAAANVTLTFTAVGNVAETVNLSSVLTAGLSLSGLQASINLQPNQSLNVPIKLTPSANTPVNSTLTGTITAKFNPLDEVYDQTVSIPIRIVVPGADKIASAAVSAKRISNDVLALQLDGLATALTKLVQNSTDEIFKSQTLAALKALIPLLAAEQYLGEVVPELTKDVGIFENSNSADEIRDAADSLAVDMSTLNDLLVQVVAHRLALFLDAHVAVSQPNVPARFNVGLQNLGAQTTTYDLSSISLPGNLGNVSASFNKRSITLQPGETSFGGTEWDPLESTCRHASLSIL